MWPFAPNIFPQNKNDRVSLRLDLRHSSLTQLSLVCLQSRKPRIVCHSPKKKYKSFTRRHYKTSCASETSPSRAFCMSAMSSCKSGASFYHILHTHCFSLHAECYLGEPPSSIPTLSCYLSTRQSKCSRTELWVMGPSGSIGESHRHGLGTLPMYVCTLKDFRI